MTILRTAVAELIGMFVDDGSLALALAVMIAIVAVAVKLLWISPLSGAYLLFAGCALLLVESVSRAARIRMKPKD